MYITLSEINQKLADSGFISDCEKKYADTIKATVDDILKNKPECAVVLISGPSGSGKTTTAMMLEKEFDSRGHETHVLSMDNYFYPMNENEQKLALEDKIDLESPSRVDIPFLNAQLKDIIACKSVSLPKFNFVKNVREDSGKVLKRKPGEIVIMEGIHALNPSVIDIPEDKRVGIYVSVRTRVKTPDNKMIHPEYIRLIRRLHRDCVHRGRSFIETLKMYPRVQRGENMYILPYKHFANYEFDTFQPYELNVFKFLDFDSFNKISDAVPELMELLQDAKPLDPKLVGKCSLLREFIGDGEFEY